LALSQLVCLERDGDAVESDVGVDNVAGVHFVKVRQELIEQHILRVKQLAVGGNERAVIIVHNVLHDFEVCFYRELGDDFNVAKLNVLVKVKLQGRRCGKNPPVLVIKVHQVLPLRRDGVCLVDDDPFKVEILQERHNRSFLGLELFLGDVGERTAAFRAKRRLVAEPVGKVVFNFQGFAKVRLASIDSPRGFERVRWYVIVNGVYM
jgi:hypothetical protein